MIYCYATLMKKPGLILIAFLLWNCGKEKEQCVFAPDLSAVQVALEIEHFEDTLAGIETKKELADFLSRHPVIRDEMLRRAEYPDDSVFVNEMFKRFTNPG